MARLKYKGSQEATMKNYMFTNWEKPHRNWCWKGQKRLSQLTGQPSQVIPGLVASTAAFLGVMSMNPFSGSAASVQLVLIHITSTPLSQGWKSKESCSSPTKYIGGFTLVGTSLGKWNTDIFFLSSFGLIPVGLGKFVLIVTFPVLQCAVESLPIFLMVGGWYLEWW